MEEKKTSASKMMTAKEGMEVHPNEPVYHAEEHNFHEKRLRVPLAQGVLSNIIC